MLKLVVGIGIGLLFAATAAAQDVPVYTDGFLSGFDGNSSYGGGYDFNNATPFHNGPPSIALTGTAGCNAISFYHAGGAYAAANYTLRFFVHGGAAGGQSLYLYLQINGGTGILNPVQINPYIAGGTIPANAWAQVTVPLGSLAFNANGSNFDRIDLANDDCTVQPTLYIDDVSLVAPSSAPSANYIFGDSFEPEYMLVPQYTSNSINVYQRNTNTTDFSYVRTATLAASIKPNSLSFAPDGNLWVVDDGNSQMLRYSLQSILTGANPVAASVSHSAAGFGGLYDMAFFGDYAYVASDGGIIKFATFDLNNQIANAPTQFNSASLSTPAGLAFDAQGRLWICNNGNSSAVRMNNLNTGNIDVTLTDAAVGARHAMISSEGVAFDEYGSLWVGNNFEPTISAYADTQLNASGSPTPVYHIDFAPALGSGDIGAAHPTGYVGGIAFDRRGDVRANYEYDYSVQAYTVSGGLAYTGALLTALSNATTDPGRGGIAIWPVPSTLHR